MKKVLWGTALLVAMSCGGMSTERRRDGASGTGGSGDGEPIGKGGGPGKAGSPSGKGGTYGKGGGPGLGGAAGFGATGGKGAVGGTAGEPRGGFGPGGDGSTAGAGDCAYYSIGSGRRCENAGSRVQDETSERVAGATDILACFDACNARADCTAVTHYFNEPGLDSCRLLSGPCNDVGTDSWVEEDAGKEYRKVCDASGICRLEYLGNWLRCLDGGTSSRLVSATSRADCDAACLASSTCTGVVDHFWLGSIRGCYLYTSTCDAPEALPFGDAGETFRKQCD